MSLQFSLQYLESRQDFFSDIDLGFRLLFIPFFRFGLTFFALFYKNSPSPIPNLP